MGIITAFGGDSGQYRSAELTVQKNVGANIPHMAASGKGRQRGVDVHLIR